MLTQSTLSLADAKAVAAAATRAAADEGWAVVVAVLDAGGHLLYLERMDGTQVGSVDAAVCKASTAFLYKRPSKALEDTVAGGRAVMMALPGSTPIEGGLPLLHDGQMVGAIGVSGVQSFQDGVAAQAGADVVSNL